MTRKIRSIQSWNRIEMPMICKNGLYCVDTSSRCFCEDIPYGLCIIKGVGVLCNVETPIIDEMLKWYESVKDVQYFVDGEFCGIDLKDTAIPQNFGIDSMKKLKEFYSYNDCR